MKKIITGSFDRIYADTAESIPPDKATKTLFFLPFMGNYKKHFLFKN